MSVYVRALWHLIRFHYYIQHGNFALLHQRVRSFRCSPPSSDGDQAARLCAAMDLVCLYYPTQVLCLQRSAATVCLLRAYGVPARMIIGVQPLPQRAHAWVEVRGRIVNDRSYLREMYAELDSC